MEEKNIPTEEPRGGGLFLRTVFCVFMVLALCSLFALHTVFSEKARAVFKSALTETSENIVTKALDSGIFPAREERSTGGYIPESLQEEPGAEVPQEAYPNPIIMPSAMSGSAPSSDL